MNNLYQILTAGGITIIPLLLCSCLTITLAIERAIFWWQLKSQQKNLLKRVLQVYAQDSDAAKKLLQNYPNLAIARIFTAALILENATPTEFALALDSQIQAEIPPLKRFNNIFEIIVGLAPLLGLLGTVLGLITSFSSLKIGDVGGSKAIDVSAGISEALISTAVGLIVAVMALLVANIFRSFYTTQVAFLDQASTQLELLYLRAHRLNSPLNSSVTKPQDHETYV